MGLKYIGFGLWYPILRIPWPLRIQNGDYFQYSYPTFSNVMENIEHHKIMNCIGAHHFHNYFDCNLFQLLKNSDWLLIVHTSISSFEIQGTYLKKTTLDLRTNTTGAHFAKWLWNDNLNLMKMHLALIVFCWIIRVTSWFCCHDVHNSPLIQYYGCMYYPQTYNISRNLVGNKIVDHSDVVRASPVGAALITSSSPT